jgi:hypothetical protein
MSDLAVMTASYGRHPGYKVPFSILHVGCAQTKLRERQTNVTTNRGQENRQIDET